MDKKSKIPLSILLSGYIFSLGFYFIWCFYFFSGRQYTYDSLFLIIAVVSAITVVYLLPFFLISYIKSFQKIWASFSLVSIITLLIFFLIPTANNLLYHISYDNKLNLKQDKNVKTIEKNEPGKKILVPNSIKINKQLEDAEDAKEKVQSEQKLMEEMGSQLNNSLETNDFINTSIAELQAQLESERKENDKLRKKLNETIRKLRSKAIEERKVGKDVIVKRQSNRDSSEIKINSKTDNTDLDTKNQGIIIRVQIISSSSRLSTNSPKFKDIKNVWEYRDSGLYKYTVGNQLDLKSAFALQSEFRRRGFIGAFVVAFKNGKRIPVREARKLLN